VAGILVATGRWDSAIDESAVAFFRRAFDPRALSWRWYVVIISLILILAFTPVLLDRSAVQEKGLFDHGPSLFLLIGFVFGALEEPGWRGYAQEALQRRMSVLAASLVVGVFWAAWHLPLFFITGTYQAGLGVGTGAFWSFHLAILVACPTFAWLYNAVDRVTLAPVLYHGVGNVVRELVPDVSNVAEVGVEAGLAAAIMLLSWELMRRRRLGPQAPCTASNTAHPFTDRERASTPTASR
jgi:membrane protease YdiL (CAAX protease family)